MNQKELHTVACWPNQSARLNQWRRSNNPGCRRFTGHAREAGAGTYCQSTTSTGNCANLQQEGWLPSATLTKVALAPFKHHKTSVMAAADWHQSPGQTNGLKIVWNSGGWEWGDIQGRPGVITGGWHFSRVQPKEPLRWSAIFFFFFLQNFCQEDKMCRRETGKTAVQNPKPEARER